ncbi:MAG: 2-dehydro-3-deoxyphosphogluconate aldolase [Microvirga sp.]|jgi:2-dehydro-3-deoxyphosphogluconate aldolase/(4S)-4-hydroxy-2-oxoglutarate aldolase|nr:2-dehydro-3-deoxyphosphogluconate aldolase [Microvirga sp.]MCD6071847.1 2-dehydro-3-deoxyphosphogluconate aldolase [Microvirga sp.]MDF2688377.1 2-dehydro-3-deoxyphosphogluconate aldolase [Microvirga sp.]MDF2970967.1 2-dehydro-3-deoxyphosphogluconate aldolase [Microvirga sp.]
MTQDLSALAESRDRQLADLLRSGPVVPVITLERVEDAVPLARALVAGGLRLLEITLRTPAAADAAAAIIRDVPEAIVGIGTVLTPKDLERAQALGARYALSPGATPDLLAAASRSEMPFIPGIATASELMMALAHGFQTVKFFPAVAAGGIPALKALAGPFPQARFCPTGGIDEKNLKDWLALPNVVAIGGSWICSTADIRAQSWDEITAKAQKAVASARA